MLNLMDEEEIIPTLLTKKKTTVYIISSYLKARLTYKRFLKKGQRINMQEIGPYSFLTSKKGSSISSVDYIDKKSGSVVVCYHYGISKHNLVTDKKESEGVLAHGFEQRICNFKSWKDFEIYAIKSFPIYFTNKREDMVSYQTLDHFEGEFSGGYNAYSRNCEVSGNLFFYINTKAHLMVIDMSAELKNTKCNPFPHFWKESDDAGARPPNKSNYLPVKNSVVLIQEAVNYFFVQGSKVFFADRMGNIFEIVEPVSATTKPNPKYVKIASFTEEFTTMNYFHHNVVGGSFQVSERTSHLHLFNVKTGMQTELKIQDSPKPIHKIEMFIKNSLTFGIALNKGFDMHVFGIHLCRMYIFRSKVKIAAEYTSGLLFLHNQKDTVLIYGDSNYNMKFKITM